jgi:putative heme-binding domain-containing protein
LFGEGEQIAPDLTGSNRDNLDYLLMNILDPSGVVPQAFKVSVIVLDDGRVITGVIGRDDGETVDIQTAKEKVTIPKSDIDIVKPSDLSLMPDGLFEKLSKDEIRNLIGYLQSRRRPTP